ncbi:PREDICTED: uncharacterized protein LOC104810842 [Tarenaya hassleriana]|uniref:uncharacterized protein LOC104810842 n=1 Tax=Tarenaya hassleriana TaxID=28532 RepID=UPI00053C3FC4|nr:PREDICTED: uncharacterized protein LOC104810842 [Tarenaya hassleriana]
MESEKLRGISFRSILLHSLWTTLTGVLLFRLAASNARNQTYVKLFAISGTLLVTLPWIVQLLVSSVVISLHSKTKGYDLDWIVRRPSKAKVTAPSLPCRQVVDEGEADEIEIRIVIGADGRRRRVESGNSASPLGMVMEIEGRNSPKMVTDGSD